MINNILIVKFLIKVTSSKVTLRLVNQRFVAFLKLGLPPGLLTQG